MKIYHFPPSSASYRVRIACGLKQIDYEEVLVNLRDNEQRQEGYLNVSPSGLVPALEDGNITLSQSLAIIRYLDQLSTNPVLIPKDSMKEARVLEMVYTICCDVHPLNNLRVLNYLRNNFEADEEAVKAWARNWITLGFDALESYIKQAYKNFGEGNYCLGEELSLVDVCLAPQLFNARRFDTPLQNYPVLMAIEEKLNQIPAFKLAAP